MGQEPRNTIKSYFQTGDIPNQNQYVDLIDSFVALTKSIDFTPEQFAIGLEELLEVDDMANKTIH